LIPGRRAGVAAGGLATGLLAAAVAKGTWAALRARPPGGPDRWDRVNHRGETLTLLEGPSYALAAAAVAAVAPGVPARLRVAAGLATLGGGFFGAIDDLHESGKSKGLRGHLGELSRGHLTTGGLKVLGIGGTGLLAAALAVPAADDQKPAHGVNRLVDVVVGGAVIAGSANLLNLFDLRPGRALKVVLLVAPTAAGGPSGRLVAAAAGAAAALLPIDLSEQAMLGDTGANAAGALLGTAAAAGLSRRGRVGLLLGLAALTLASERVSFTTVIERTPGLRDFDALGRRPPERAGKSEEPSRRPPG
jgi:UDP-GlcNAc:undecaprenyl-phosphate/decaprenyl-phosphate GlcNAc-1-phosphate transferase